MQYYASIVKISLYSRLGPRVGDRNNQRFGQLESDGEEEEDDGKKVWDNLAHMCTLMY
jgi:hypothetical protein